MISVLVVYATSLGNTQKMAIAVADGARSVESVSVSVKTASEATHDDVSSCDALIIGTPVRHRTADARVKNKNTVYSRI